MLFGMCGIVGYAGSVLCPSDKPLEVCLQGLERLEYRGYDSAGVALVAPGMDRVRVRKKAGSSEQSGGGYRVGSVAGGDGGDRAYTLGDERCAQ